ncbi:hypothetical protein BU14_0647s0004 [Porphyra umbilicalis]|uniref:Uncharacterized protein n=1 Tax=Porphyra umbilicalis TaxID=2786 RepID=A0A1X6NQL5_PORUM|nr:hypothetical protein BU14_0647s0004 [Porphyra umbilicalis]|eukprot:OSX70865.1 hypothetical protein BU14_0647s0004 [Porphyra umbilicalis]
MGNLAMKAMSHPTVKSHVDEAEGPSARLSRRSNTKLNRGLQSVRDHCRSACDFKLSADAPPPRSAPPIVAEEDATESTFDSVHGSTRLKGLFDGAADAEGPGSSCSNSNRSSVDEDTLAVAAASSSPSLRSLATVGGSQTTVPPAALRKASSEGGLRPSSGVVESSATSMSSAYDADAAPRSVRFLSVAGIITDAPAAGSVVEPIRLRHRPEMKRPIAHVMSM